MRLIGAHLVWRGVIGFVLLCGLVPQIISAKNSMKKRTVLIITGGHDFEREPFFQMFKSFGNVAFQERAHPLGETAFAPEWNDQFDAVVFYDMNQEINDEQKRAFVQMASNGIGLIFLHHSLASYQNWPEYEKMLGGKYLLAAESKQGKLQPASTFKHDVLVPVEMANPLHPITTGSKDFVLRDEVYGGLTTWAEVHPLLLTHQPDSSPVIAWTHQYGKSRVVVLQPGHDHHTYENMNFRKLLRRAIDWASQ